MQSDYFALNTPFKPSPSLMTWFVIDFFLFVAFMTLVTKDTQYNPGYGSHSF